MNLEGRWPGGNPFAVSNIYAEVAGTARYAL
jgi:hypothetical protein